MSHVLSILNGEVSHTADYGEKEVLLPLLHLFREFLIMVGVVSGCGQQILSDVIVWYVYKLL